MTIPTFELLKVLTTNHRYFLGTYKNHNDTNDAIVFEVLSGTKRGQAKKAITLFDAHDFCNTYVKAFFITKDYEVLQDISVASIGDIRCDVPENIYSEFVDKAKTLKSELLQDNKELHIYRFEQLLSSLK